MTPRAVIALGLPGRPRWLSPVPPPSSTVIRVSVWWLTTKWTVRLIRLQRQHTHTHDWKRWGWVGKCSVASTRCARFSKGLSGLNASPTRVVTPWSLRDNKPHSLAFTSPRVHRRETDRDESPVAPEEDPRRFCVLTLRRESRSPLRHLTPR